MLRSTARFRTRRLLLGVLATLLLLGFAVPAAASAAQLTGKVTAQSGSSLGLNGTTVHVTRSSDGAAVGTDATAGLDGSYAVTVPDGTYDVTFTPPIASGYQRFTVHDYALSGPTVINVALVPADARSFAGVLRNQQGRPLQGSIKVGNVTTPVGADGVFSIALAPGRYTVEVSASSLSWNGDPTQFQARLQGTLDVSAQDWNHDVVIPAHRVVVHASGPGGADVAGVKLTAIPSQYYWPSTNAPQETGLRFDYDYYPTTSATTDASGRAALYFIRSPYDSVITAVPTPGSGLPQGQLTVRDVDADRTLELSLATARSFAGVLRDKQGNPLRGQIKVGNTTTSVGADGAFSIPLAPATYPVEVSASGTTWNGDPTSFQARLQGKLDLTTQDWNHDIVIPAHRVVVHTTGAAGADVANVKLTALPSYYYWPSTNAPQETGLRFDYDYYPTTSATTDASGHAALYFIDSPYDSVISAVPPSGSGLPQGQVKLRNVDADRTLDIPLATVRTFAGVLRDKQGNALGGQIKVGTTTTTVGADGAFSIPLAPGSYPVEVSASGATWNGDATSFQARLQGTLDLTTQDWRHDIVIPGNRVRIHATGPGGSDMPNVSLTALPSYYYWPSTNAPQAPRLTFDYDYFPTTGATTDAAGNAVLYFIDSPVASVITALPPTATTLPQTQLTVQDVDHDYQQEIVFQRSSADAIPPTVTCDSADGQWHADEVSLTCRASDDGTGLADPADATFAVTTHVGDGHEDADAHTGTRRVCDRADNCVTAGNIGGNKVDRQAPRITITQGSGSAHVVADDAGLGPVTCTVDGSPATVAGTTTNGHFEGDIALTPGPHDVRCSADDGVGHAPTTPSTPVDGPTHAAGIPTTDAFTSSPDGDDGWWRTAPATATIHVRDLSPTGLACTVDGHPVALTPITDADGFHAVVSVSVDGIHPVACTATDALGHTSSATTDLKLDTVAPTIHIVTPQLGGAYPARAALTADYGCADGTSAIASCAGDTPNGAAIDTATPGGRTFHVAARDRAGNTATADHAFTVQPATDPTEHGDYADVVRADHPLAYWRLGDGADTGAMVDDTGAHSGEYKNGAGGSLQQGISGDGNTVAIFAGNGTYGYVNGIAAPQHAYTMEAWVDADDTGDAMIGQQGGAGALFVTGGRYAFRQVDTTIRAAVGPRVGHFDHVVGTWDGTTARLYVNGHLEASAPSSKAPSGAGTLYVGYGDLAPWFRGYLDEFAYYPAALSADRVQAHYDADPPPPLWVPRAAARAPVAAVPQAAVDPGPAPSEPAASPVAPAAPSTPARPGPSGTAAPRVAKGLTITGLRPVAGGSAIRLTVRNPGTRTLRATVAVTAGGARLATATVSVGAGQSVTRAVRVTQRGRILLRRKRAVIAQVTVTPATGGVPARTSATLRARR